MATYSYSKAQLNKRDQPAKPFWSFPKIAAAIGFSGVVFIGTCIALTPRQPAPVAVAPAAPVAVAQPKPDPYKCVINGVSYSYGKAMCDKEIAASWDNFDPHSYAEEYKNALDAVAEETKPRK
jgi:hypothetical protein